MANRLKIYACSGIGSTNPEQGVLNYWTDNTDTLTNTQAVNTLLALINRNYIEVNRLRNMTADDKIANLCDIDVYTVCLAAAQRYKDNPKALEHAGVVIGMMMADGDFDYQSLNNSERDAHLDHLLDKANDLFEEEKIDHTNQAFVKWYNETIVARNKVGLTIAQQERAQAALEEISPIGDVNGDTWKYDKNISNYLLHAGTYFLYIFFSDAELNQLPAVFKIKRKWQLSIYNFCTAYFVGNYGSLKEMDNIIYSGIINDTGYTPQEFCDIVIKQGMTPEEFYKIAIKNRDTKGVGELTAAAATVIAAAITALTTIILALLTTIGEAIGRKYEALKEEAINESIPIPDDYEGLGGKRSKAGTSKWLLFALVGTATVWFMKKK